MTTCAKCNSEIIPGEGFTLDPALVVTPLDFTAFPDNLHGIIRGATGQIYFCDTCMEDE